MTRDAIRPEPDLTAVSSSRAAAGARAGGVDVGVHARRIGIASAIWAASILLSRVIGLVREAVIGRTLGASTQGDLYATAFVVPDFLNYLLAGGALSIVFIPIFGAYLARGEEERASIAFSVVANVLLVLLALATVVLWIAMPALAELVAPGLGPAERAEWVALSRIVLPAQIFHVVGGLLSASMQARDRHALPALAPLVYTLGIIAGGLVGGAEHGARGFAWGALAGSVAGPFLLPLLGALRSGLRWRPILAPWHPDVRTYLVRSLPIMVGFSIVVVDDWYLRREGTILGPGAASLLSYAKTLMKVPMGVFGLAAGVAVFPTLQRLVAEGRADEMRALVARTVRNVIALSFAAQVVVTVAGEDLVALVYGRARLSPEQIGDAGLCLAFVSIGLAAWAAQTLVARGFYALGDTWRPAAWGTLVAAAAYPLYVYGRASFGLFGLACASSAAILVYTLALGLILRARLARVAGPARDADSTGFAGFLGRATIALGAGLGVGELVLRLLPAAESPAGLAAHAAALVVASLGAFVAAARVLRVDEVTGVLGAIARRVTGRRATATR